MPRKLLLGMLLCLAACTAPQGKKIAMNNGLAPVASGPTTKLSTITLQNRDEIVSLGAKSQITVKLPSSNRNGYEWRLGEIPDPTVLKLVDKQFTPSDDPMKPGEQTLVFEAVGPGDVDVKMWYGTLWASPMNATRPFHFVASVSPEEPKPAKKSSKQSKKS